MGDGDAECRVALSLGMGDAGLASRLPSAPQGGRGVRVGERSGLTVAAEAEGRPEPAAERGAALQAAVLGAAG